MKKYIPSYEEFLNESKTDIGLSTSEETKGSIARFRISSSIINLRTVVNLSKDSSVRHCTIFGPDEIGFEDAASRKNAMNWIQKAFDSNSIKLNDYKL